jgi:hypothetical protein
MKVGLQQQKNSLLDNTPRREKETPATRLIFDERPKERPLYGLFAERAAAIRSNSAEHFQTAVNLTKARVGYVFLPSSAEDLQLEKGKPSNVVAKPL